jgi:plasmid stabilization system protein ParE
VDREVVFAPEAEADLIDMIDYIATRADAVRALRMSNGLPIPA